MSKLRIEKFTRMLNFQQKRLEQTRQRLTSQQQFRKELSHQLSVLSEEMIQLETSILPTSNRLSDYQHLELAMILVQQKLNQKQIEVATADEKLDHLLHTYREQNAELKSWEKLVEKEASNRAAAAQRIEQQQADERYLSRRFMGEAQ